MKDRAQVLIAQTSDGLDVPPAWIRWLSTAVAISCVAACIALGVYVISRAKYSGEDSWFPMGRALDFLHESSSALVYQKLFFSQHIKFQYPPTGLLFLDLLRRVGIGTSPEFNMINAVLLIMTGLVFGVFVAQLFGKVRLYGVRVPVGPIAFIVALRFYPSNLAFQIGQMQVLLGLLFALACWASFHDRRLLAGSLIALAVTVKPQFLPLGLLAFWRRDWRFVFGLAAVTSLAVVLSVSLYGYHNHVDYLSVLQFLSRHGEYQHLNQSVDGILVRWLYDGPPLDRDPNGFIPQSAFPPYIAAVYIPTLLSSLAMLALPFFVRIKMVDRVSLLLEFCTASVLFTMASPIAWAHHYNILLPVYAVGLKAALDRWKGWRLWIALALLAASFILTGYYPIVPASDPTDASRNLAESHVLFGALALVALLLLEMRTVAPDRVANHRVASPSPATAAGLS
jgi:hypothetical protein